MGIRKIFAVETSLRDLKISTQKEDRNLKSDEEDGRFDESEAYNFDNENDTSYQEESEIENENLQKGVSNHSDENQDRSEEESENENENLQKRGSNHSGENDNRSEEESDSLSPMMERLSIEIKWEKSAEKSNLRRKERLLKNKAKQLKQKWT